MTHTILCGHQFQTRGALELRLGLRKGFRDASPLSPKTMEPVTGTVAGMVPASSQIFNSSGGLYTLRYHAPMFDLLIDCILEGYDLQNTAPSATVSYTPGAGVGLDSRGYWYGKGRDVDLRSRVLYGMGVGLGPGGKRGEQNPLCTPPTYLLSKRTLE